MNAVEVLRAKIKNLQIQFEELKTYPELTLFMLTLEEEYLHSQLHSVSSQLSKCERAISKLNDKKLKIEEKINRIKKTLLYRILRLLQPVIGSVWVVRRVEELSDSISDIEAKVKDTRVYKNRLLSDQSKLEEELQMVRLRRNKVIQMEKHYLSSSLELWEKEVIEFEQRVKELLNRVEKPRVGIDNELRLICEQEGSIYAIVKEALDILRKKCQRYLDLLLRPEVLLKRIEDAGGFLKRAKRIAEIYIIVVSYPYMRKTFLEVARKAQNELYIASPYISQESLKEILRNVSEKVHVKILVKRVSDYEKAINIIRGMERVEVRLGVKVHFKLLASDKDVIISSSNISKQGLESLYEIGIVTNDPDIVDQAKAFFTYIWSGKKRYKENYYGEGGARIDTPTQTVFISSYRNIPYLLFDLMKQARKGTIIVSPYLTYGAIKKLLSYVSEDARVCVVTRVDRGGFAAGLTDPEAIRCILDECEETWNNPKLHAKVLIIDDRFAIISSLNITDDGLTKNFEAGVLTQNPAVISVLKKLVDRLKDRRLNVKELEEEFVASLAHKPRSNQPQVTVEVKEIPVHPIPAGSKLELPKIGIHRVRRRKDLSWPEVEIKAKKRIKRRKRGTVPVDLVVLEQAFVIATLRRNGKCKLDELLNEVEKKVAPRFAYFPWKLQGPGGLSDKSWNDPIVLETCLKFLEEKGIYGINLNRYEDTVIIRPVNKRVIEEFQKLFSSFFIS